MNLYISILGFTFNLIGIYLLYKYGENPNGPKSSITYLYTDAELEEIAKKEAKNNSFYSKRKVLGLIMTIIGTVIQFLISL